jgi:hypothetical protein
MYVVYATRGVRAHPVFIPHPARMTSIRVNPARKKIFFRVQALDGTHSFDSLEQQIFHRMQVDESQQCVSSQFPASQTEHT